MNYDKAHIRSEYEAVKCTVDLTIRQRELLATPLPGQSADVKSLPISVPPPKHFLVVCSDSKRPCFRKPPDPYRNIWPLCLVFRRPQIDTFFQARFL